MITPATGPAHPSLDSTDLTPLQVLNLEKQNARMDPTFIIRARMLKIKSKIVKSGGTDLINFVPNEVQLKVIASIREMRKKDKPIRLVILKGRQFGISTLAEALIYCYTSQWANVNSLIMSDDDDGSNYLFEMTKLYHEEMEKDNPHLVPKRRISNEKKLEFHHKRSQILIDTAKNVDAGRKYTFHMAHLSEVARFRDFDQSLLSLMQSVPNAKNTMVILETTANGENQFCLFWRRIKAEFEKGLTDWVPVFLSWKDHSEYSRAFTIDSEKEHFEKSLSKDERFVMDTHKLSLEQMNWRRNTIANNCRGDATLFKQEFPLDDQEAFLSSDKRIFSEYSTRPQEKNICEPKLIGDIEMVDNRPAFVPNDEGFTKIWKVPQTGHNYVLASDSCDGVGGGDDACAQVVDRTTWEQVATIHGNIPPDLFGNKINAIGRWYKFALVAPEVNGPGLVTTLRLRDLNYPNIVHRSRINIDDAGMLEESDELGWHTNQKTKPLIISDLSEALREILLVIHDAGTLAEVKAFSILERKENGFSVMGASKGYHDDRVISLAIAVHFAKTVAEFKDMQRMEDPPLISNRKTGY